MTENTGQVATKQVILRPRWHTRLATLTISVNSTLNAKVGLYAQLFVGVSSAGVPSTQTSRFIVTQIPCNARNRAKSGE